MGSDKFSFSLLWGLDLPKQMGKIPLLGNYCRDVRLSAGTETVPRHPGHDGTSGGSTLIWGCCRCSSSGLETSSERMRPADSLNILKDQMIPSMDVF